MTLRLHKPGKRAKQKHTRGAKKEGKRKKGTTKKSRRTIKHTFTLSSATSRASSTESPTLRGSSTSNQSPPPGGASRPPCPPPTTHNGTCYKTCEQRGRGRQRGGGANSPCSVVSKCRSTKTHNTSDHACVSRVILMPIQQITGSRCPRDPPFWDGTWSYVFRSSTPVQQVQQYESQERGRKNDRFGKTTQNSSNS